MTTDTSSPTPAGSARAASGYNLARSGKTQSGVHIADLDDHRLRRVRTQPLGPGEIVDAQRLAVTVLVFAGSPDQEWLREFAATHLLSSTELPRLEQPGRISADPASEPADAQRGSMDCLTVGELRMDLDQMRVQLAGQPITLRRREFLLLKAFMEHPGRVLSREQLLEQAWGDSDWKGDRTVDVHVRRVRVKLGERAPQITTVRGFGYRFEPCEDKPTPPMTAARGRPRLR
ncbi:winged helix-turn-helix domain-containing protein [uncultured Jatrophihabitans sp.]|uniref:winged helix-turn-helix domain-containing protein n=1 Tax=uncultured Jatrophihabitans sp. TaxID=1610747 RepID=UPI0035C9640C